MKASSIVAIISILIVISITVIIGAKLIRDIVRSNSVKNDIPPDDTAEEDTSEDEGEEEDEQVDPYDITMEPASLEGLEGGVFDAELPADIVIVQTIHTPTRPQVVPSEGKIEEISSRMLNEEPTIMNEVVAPEDEEFYDFVEQSNIPIDTSFNILSVEEADLPWTAYVDIDESDDEPKIESGDHLVLQLYDGDDDF